MTAGTAWHGEESANDLEQLHAALEEFSASCSGEQLAAGSGIRSSAYEAGWSLACDLIRLAPSAGGSSSPVHQAIRQVVERFADLYRVGDESTRRCLVDAVLEHVFEEQELVAFFDAWRLDPILSQAVDEASEWSDHVRKIKTFLKQLEPLVTSELQDRYPGAESNDFCFGSDVLVLEWPATETHNEGRIALECQDELAQALVEGFKPSKTQLERYAFHVANSDNWLKSDLFEEELRVRIPLEP